MSRAVAIAIVVAAGCRGSGAPDDPVRVGLLLSYTGALAATSINSERGLLMAVEAVNDGGGIGGRAVMVMARDTGSDPARVSPRAQELIDAGAAVFIGPDTPALGVQLKPILGERTVIMPSYATADSDLYKPPSWFVMGPSPRQLACELHTQLVKAGRTRPLLLVDPNGYNNLLGRELTFAYGVREVFLPTDDSLSETVVPAITAANADAYVLAAMPQSATSLLYPMAAVGALADPATWYLSPTLRTPALLETVPKGMLEGAQGVSPGTAAGTHDFRVRFSARWQDEPLEDAYAFYDGAAVALLALQRAVVQEGGLPQGTGLDAHIRAVTHAGATPVLWNELGRGLALLAAGQEVGYVGLSGPLEFDASGQTQGAQVSWWHVTPQGFENIARQGDCR
jgi:ABC-type branched-subunit amino acid transport system substrate-binding protein